MFLGDNMTQSSVPAPSVKLTSFACPVCGAHATQNWLHVFLKYYHRDQPTPTILSLDEIVEHEAKIANNRDAEENKPLVSILQLFRRMLQGEPFIGNKTDTIYSAHPLENVFISRCYTCDALAIWLHDRLIYPPMMTGPTPNPDLSDDVRHDYMEAREILDLSPREAAALLRLAVEKICTELNAEGDDINKKIAFLVSKGLDEGVQQALDAVRVIGNEAVHPGQIDLRDDRETATKLFDLVNFIAEDQISRPKQRMAIYNMIPEGKRKAIDTRNAKALREKQ